MIITRTPYRISFFGGGTDYPAWYLENGGAVLSTSINKYCYVTCRFLPPFFEHRLRVVWSRIELVNRSSEIVHPSVRETLRFLGIEEGVEIHHDGDLPGQSGMGSSSAFTVGLLHALRELQGERTDQEALAKDSIEIERHHIGETVGSQDQVSVAHGGLNRIDFMRSGEFSVNPVNLPYSRVVELSSHLMLFYTGMKRISSDVASSYARDFSSRETLLRTIREHVDQGVAIIASGSDISNFGELLHEAWRKKRELSDMVSSPDIDSIYEKVRSAGAIGGKLLGAGGGGFFLVFAPPSTHQRIRKELRGFVSVPFEMEKTGSQIIFSNRE